MSSEPIGLVVVDSSVAYKWFSHLGESCVAEARAILDAHLDGRRLIAAPGHMPAEVVNGLRYAKLDRDTLRTAIEGLAEAELLIHPLTEELLLAAADIALANGLTVHDALFPALATLLDAELVTADRVQARVTECRVRLLA